MFLVRQRCHALSRWARLLCPWVSVGHRQWLPLCTVSVGLPLAGQLLQAHPQDRISLHASDLGSEQCLGPQSPHWDPRGRCHIPSPGKGSPRSVLAGGVSEGQGDHISCLLQFPVWGSLLFEAPPLLPGNTTQALIRSAPAFPSPSPCLCWYPPSNATVFCSLFLSYVRKKGWLGVLSPTATTRQPSSQARNIPWVFQLECLTVLTSPAQRYRLAEVCLCPWHCVTADPTPSSTADCHRLHRVFAIPHQDTHTHPHPVHQAETLK